MGLFSSLFGGGAKKEDINDENVQALKQFFKEKLPASYVKSPKYAVSITKTSWGYAARLTLDMLADGSDYSGFSKNDFAGLSDLESDYVFDQLTSPPVSVMVTLDMDFGGKNHTTVEKSISAN